MKPKHLVKSSCLTSVSDKGSSCLDPITAHVCPQEEFWKFGLPRRSRLFFTKVLINFYFKVILPSVISGLVLRGSCFDVDSISWIIFNLSMT